jgi:ATP-dependent Clp protease ATP-binding subunit ClpA
MTGELSSEYSGVSFRRPMSIQTGEVMRRRDLRLHAEMGERAISIDGNTVLAQPETGHRILERHLRSAIIGQDQAIDAVLDAMDLSGARSPDNPRPLATFAFLGPTGVGKSETAKVLADFISGGNPRLVKIDCSNFSHGHEVASLVGSPPGYVGDERAVFLNKKKVERPGTIVLFDEIEKGSPPLFNLMLQILGDGKLQLNDGTETSFRETMIIMTSNLGAKEMSEHLRKSPGGFGVDREEPGFDVITKSAQKAFREFFSPEFVNRIDSTVVFNPLNREAMSKILDNKLSEVNEQYGDTYGMAIALTEGAQSYLLDKTFEERGMGARPLVRAFEKEVQSTFGRYLSGRQLSQGSQLFVYHRSECTDEVRAQLPDQELIFTQRFDEELYEKHEAYKREQGEERRRIEDERLRLERENAEKERVVAD